MGTRFTAKNQSQKIASFLRGSKLTVWGSGGQTEATIGEGPVSNYAPPVGKKAKVKGTLSVNNMGSNTILGCQLFDNSRGQGAHLVELTGIGQASFQAVLTEDDRINFFGNNVANNGAGACIMEVIELPE